MPRQSREEYRQEVNELLIEISKLFAYRYPKGTAEYAPNMLSALGAVIANILSDIDEDHSLEEVMIKQIRQNTKAIRQRKEDGEEPDFRGKMPDIN
jgi:hypothetical protein